MKIFVTGGAGFIGRHLVESLNHGNEVTIFENFSNSSKQEISYLLQDGVTLVQGDMTDLDLLKKVVRDYDLVIHLAAKIDIKESIKNPHLSNEINVNGTINLLKACVDNGVLKFIAASSASIYGDPSVIPVTEETVPNPISPYAADKLAMESYVRAFANTFKMNSISLRFFNVYGKSQSNAYAGVITKFMQGIASNKPLVVFGDGKNTRDYIHIKDLVQGISKAIDHIDGKKGRTYNIAAGKSVSVNELAELMISISGKNLEIQHDPPREGDLRFSEANIQMAIDELNYQPNITLKEGLSKLLLNR